MFIPFAAKNITWHFCPWFDFPCTKSTPFHAFLFANKTWRTQRNTLLIIKLHDLLVLSETLFVRGPGTHCHMPLPRSSGDPSHTQVRILWSSTSCIIHKAKLISSREIAAQNTPQIYLILKPARFPATFTLHHPREHHQTYAAKFPDKKTALDFGPV